MNILLFIIPKNDTAYLYDDFTLRQALEKMEYHGYSAIPIISRDGKYVGTLTEGDLLRTIKARYQLNIRKAENFPIMKIHRKMDSEPVSINTKMEDLVIKAMNQNFVPVVDDRGVYIGIITRKAIIKFFYDKACANHIMEE
jgi:CBS domain-containing protein